jgi:hypothetical protein
MMLGEDAHGPMALHTARACQIREGTALREG